MKNILKEEMNQIQYLFGYKRGVVISEQIDPNVSKKIELIQNMKNNETNTDTIALYDKIIDYYTKQSKGETVVSPDERYTNFIDSKFSTPKLPKSEVADLGNAPKEVIDYFNSTKTEHPNSVLSLGYTIGNNREIAYQKAIDNAKEKLKIDYEPIPVGERMVYPKKEGGYDVYAVFEPKK